MRLLVAFGSKRGGTSGLAAMLGAALSTAGCEAVVVSGARGHVTFGGRLAPDAKGFPASAMAKTNAGDWRDPEHVRGWVAAVAKELQPLGSCDFGARRHTERDSARRSHTEG